MKTKADEPGKDDMIEPMEGQETQPGQTQQRVTRNAGIYLSVQIVSWCVTFVGLGIIPLRLGEQVAGEFGLATSTIGIVLTFGGLCLENCLIREISRDAGQADKLVRATIGLRLTMSAILFAAAYLMLHSLHANPAVMTYGLLIFPASLINMFSDPLRATLMSGERAREVSLSDLCLTISPLLAIPFLYFGVRALIVAATVVQVATFLLRARWLRGVVRIRPSFDVRIWKRLIRGGVPFMMNNYVGMFYSYLTLLVLNHFMKEAAIGEYNQANRLIGTFLVIPTVLSSALLPVLTRMAAMDRKSFDQAKIRVLVVLIVSCLPIIIGVMLLAEPLCHLLYMHKFIHVPLALQLGSVLLLPLYVINVVYQFLVAQNRNAIWAAVLAGTIILNTIFAWLLVPYTLHTVHNGIVGATIANAIAEFAAMGFAFALLQVNPFAPALVGRVLRGVLATAVMALVIWATREWTGHLPLPFRALAAVQLFVSAGVGAAVFLLLAGLLRAFPHEEQELVMKTLRKKFRRAA